MIYSLNQNTKPLAPTVKFNDEFLEKIWKKEIVNNEIECLRNLNADCIRVFLSLDYDNGTKVENSNYIHAITWPWYIPDFGSEDLQPWESDMHSLSFFDESDRLVYLSAYGIEYQRKLVAILKNEFLKIKKENKCISNYFL